MIQKKIDHTIYKRRLLLIEKNLKLRTELSTFLSHNFKISVANSIEQAIKMLNKDSFYFSIITNINLHPDDFSLMDGFTFVRHVQSLYVKIPVIVYTPSLHPLATIESQNCGAFKILDLSHPDFRKSLIDAIRAAINILLKKLYFSNSTKHSARIKETLSSIPLVTPISWNCLDENLYNSFYNADTNNMYRYANNWAYICQAARYNGHKFFNGSCLITIATDNVTSDDDIQFYLMNPTGKSSVKKTLELACCLKKFSGKPVIIKKITKLQAEQLLKSEYCKELAKPDSSNLEDYYDDIHPQIVVNLKAFMNYLTPEKKYISHIGLPLKKISERGLFVKKYNRPKAPDIFKVQEKRIFQVEIPDKIVKFRYTLKKFSQRNIVTKPIRPELFDDFIDVVVKWKRTYIRRYEEEGRFEKIPENDDYYISPYFPIFEYYSKNVNNCKALSYIVYVDDVPVGFSFLGQISTHCMGMYANICDTDFDGLSEYMIYTNLSRAYWLDYKYVNLGGTEHERLYRFYNKFKLSYGDAKSFELKTKYLIYE